MMWIKLMNYAKLGLLDHVCATSRKDLTSALNELSTDWKFKKYNQANLHYVEPLTVTCVEGNESVTDLFQYVSLLDSLQMLLTVIYSRILRSTDTN
jgi:hypothetical protein